jgi:glyoxylase-like metal-dependent hydrolase (beta-lactamase superfamily II)
MSARWTYTKGLHDLGNGCWAWLLPDGSWGYSNAGLVADGGETLLVDTLFDLRLTREMLEGMQRAVPGAARIDTLVNTHANGDHTFGNQLVEGARIVAARGTLEDMRHRPPEEFVRMLRERDTLGEAGAFMWEVMGSRFHFFDGIRYTPPTEVFDGAMTMHVGGKRVELVDVGPAHTRGDVLVHVPDDRTVFTGDILFVNGHPAVWAGPVSNWIAACDRILGWDVEIVVPGHGPITDKSGVRALRDYLVFLRTEARKRWEAGMSDEEATRDINFDAFRDWSDEERIYVNVNACYREFENDRGRPDVLRMFTLMARHHAAKQRAAAAGEGACGAGCADPTHRH